jgi:hypothetical protein
VLDKPVPSYETPARAVVLASFGVGVVVSGGIPLATISIVAGTFFPQILLESLILAQDERWRRA